MTIRGGFMTRLQGGDADAEMRLKELSPQALQLLWRYLRAYPGKLLLALVATLTVSATTLAQPYLMKVAVDTHIAAGDLRGLSLTALLYFGLVGVFWLAIYWQGYLSTWLGQQVVHDLRRDLFAQVQRQSIAFVEEERIGGIMSRLTHDVNAVADIAASGALNLINDLVTLVGIIAIMALMNLSLTLATLVTVPIVVFSMAYIGKQMRRTYREVQQAMADVNQQVEQSVVGMRVSQSMAKESFTMEQFESLSLRNMKANLKAGLLFAAVFPTMTVTNMIGVVVVLAVGGTQASQGQMTIGVLLAFLGYVYRFFGPLRELGLVYNSFQAAAASLDRLHDYLKRPVSLPAPAQPQRPPDGFQGEIMLQEVTFGYEPGQAILHDVGLTIAKGETIALVGATGAGKTSLARLLARLYDPQQGRILVDGIDVRQIGQADLRQVIILVPQEVFLFADSIRENIRFGRPTASDAEVEAAARQAQAHDFIQRLPHGYDGQVGELGAMLSGGQRQLIAFARALLADPKVLILDEATANVDPFTEALLQRAIENLRQDRTTIIIAHRFSTLRNADRIVVIDNGQLAGQGSHAALIQDNEAYQRLYQRLWADPGQPDES